MNRACPGRGGLVRPGGGILSTVRATRAAGEDGLRAAVEPGVVFDVRQGWAPLCEFLGVEAPDEPFPRLNEAREMRRRLLGLVALSAAAPALAVLLGVAATVFLVRRVARSRYR